ncbi:50S ribosomal protein L18 [Candidatus Campbellbacteria bacterium RIFOXYC2_FULL_35_25]|uniref:Large ribosomal subunit protein uL18 n=1 Tax=Candidatus Campbellbacteria bacterium RIFOXYC2_FULL_35_25 TaxID=1797582 RepID=A0A1F5EJP8_9BACT|nr:MAG: 50S ribosomal protein L18 [Candidatus Campbellbacteria bacterium RIFOXYC2_FULL_35_25]
MSTTKVEKRNRRRNRIRAKITGTSKVPRLSVFKSNKAIYVQIIDDENGKTLVSYSSEKVKGEKDPAKKAQKIGSDLAKMALEKKIKKVVFDRGGYIYTGKVKAIADGAREGGLEF